jgi:hypothetical protein
MSIKLSRIILLSCTCTFSGVLLAATDWDYGNWNTENPQLLQVTLQQSEEKTTQKKPTPDPLQEAQKLKDQTLPLVKTDDPDQITGQ